MGESGQEASRRMLSASQISTRFTVCTIQPAEIPRPDNITEGWMKERYRPRQWAVQLRFWVPKRRGPGIRVGRLNAYQVHCLKSATRMRDTNSAQPHLILMQLTITQVSAAAPWGGSSFQISWLSFQPHKHTAYTCTIQNHAFIIGLAARLMSLKLLWSGKSIWDQESINDNGQHT